MQCTCRRLAARLAKESEKKVWFVKLFTLVQLLAAYYEPPLSSQLLVCNAHVGVLLRGWLRSPKKGRLCGNVYVCAALNPPTLAKQLESFHDLRSYILTAVR